MRHNHCDSTSYTQLRSMVRDIMAGKFEELGSSFSRKVWDTLVTENLGGSTTSQSFTVALPFNFFKSTPLCQATLATTLPNVILSYDYASSTKELATFSLTTLSGEALPLSSYTFCLQFIEQNI